MATNFEPNERQRRLIAEATALAADAHEPGRQAPAELVRRMTMEGSAAMLFPDSHDARRESASPTFRITLAAAVGGPVTRDAVIAMLGADTCRGAAVFKAPRHIVLLEFELPAETHDMAVTTCVSEVLRGLPQAEFINLNDQNSLVDELVEASEGREPTLREMVRMMHSDAPSTDAFARAAAAVGVLAWRTVGARLVEADVFDVHPEFGIAHLATPDGRMLCVTERTPGIASLSRLEDGQRYRCWVQGRSNLVVLAEPTD